ncbi:MAG: CRISPR-associated endonuclease Cas1 [Caldilineaceae bacterium]|jgi:CRISPR-associated protein Cas1|nr:CRISPR-associated endonuclease Cas1 [Caldilineaceae bacterium]
MAIVQHLIVDEYGSFVGKKSERLSVTCQGEKRVEAPLMHLETVLITGKGISLSSDAVAACAEGGIPIHFLDTRGHPVGSLYSASLTATIQTRRAQLQAREGEKGLAFAKALAAGKLRNQSNLLKYLTKNRREKQPEVYAEVRLLADEVLDHLAELERCSGASVDACRGVLLSIEGRAAQKYWAGIKQLFLNEVAWPGRRTQGAMDPFNAALNYGYGILYGQVERALVLAGLDPYAGFLHVDRPGKPSLVFDLVEEFRQTVVDRTVLAMVNRGMVVEMDERGRLTEAARHSVAEKVIARLEGAEPYENKRHPLRAIIQMQARHLATFLRDERPVYEAFVSSW